ncbi:MAG: hypothetical protein P8188_08580 [Gemmatimonadota bacterium]|jgi:hypothetical protein
MTDPGGPGPPAGEPVRRLYSDDEVARILERATEIRQERSLAAPRSQGLSLVELEEIAREAGIDVSHLRQAALELDTGAVPGRSEGFWGAERRILVETVIPGVIPEERLRRAVDVIEEVLEERGNTSWLGGTLTWRTEMVQGKVRATSVSLGSEGGSTRIRVDEDLKMVAQSYHGGLLWGGGFGVGFGVGLPIALAAGAPWLAVAFLAGTLGVGFTSARALFRRHVEKRREVVAELMRRLAAVIQEEGSRTSLPPDRSGEPGPGGRST